MPLVTHYQRLDLAEGASPEAIEDAYRALVARLRPPPGRRAGDGEAGVRELAQAEQAYAVLSDPARRREHDAWILAQRRAPINALAIGKFEATPALADRTLLEYGRHAPLTKILKAQPVSLLVVLGLLFVAVLLESLGVWGKALAPENASVASLLPAVTICWGLLVMEGRKWLRRALVLALAARGAWLLGAALEPGQYGLGNAAGVLLALYVGFLLAAACHLLLLDNTEWQPLRWLALPAAIGWAVGCYFASVELVLPWLLQAGEGFVSPVLTGWLVNALPDMAGLAITLHLYLATRQARLNTQIAWAVFTCVPALLLLAHH